MEAEGLLDPNDDIDLYALHLVYLPKIQAQLDLFRRGWCFHRLRTEGNRTPHQLWIMGLQNLPTDHSCVEGLTAPDVVS